MTVALRIGRLRSGWNRLGDHVGCHHFPNVGTRIVTARGMEVEIRGKVGYLPPRAILTIRDGSPQPTVGVLRPHGQPWDFNAPGGFEISPCGDGRIALHDQIMQRCPVALRDMDSGEVRENVQVNGYYRLTRGWNKVQTLPEYVSPASSSPYDDTRLPRDVGVIANQQVRSKVLAFLPYDGQHLIRAFRAAIRNQADPIVQLDIADLAADAAIAWGNVEAQEILAGPSGKGHGAVGREWAWVAYLAVLAGHDELAGRCIRIAAHVQMPNGLLQRLKHGSFYGSPDPWAMPPNGSGVPAGTDVAQDIEAHMQIVALCQLGMVHEAQKLFDLVCLNGPLKKWIACDTGAGVGHHPADFFNPWFSIGALAAFDPSAASIAALRWRVPTAGGSSVGPFSSIAQVKSALRAWKDPGKARWALERLA